MATVEDSPLWIDGTLTAGNIAGGVVTITPVADTVTGVAVTGLTLTGSGNIYGFATPSTISPAARAGTTAGVRSVSVSGADATSFTVNIYRTNTVETRVFWFAVRDV